MRKLGLTWFWVTNWDFTYLGGRLLTRGNSTAIRLLWTCWTGPFSVATEQNHFIIALVMLGPGDCHHWCHCIKINCKKQIGRLLQKMVLMFERSKVKVAQGSKTSSKCSHVFLPLWTHAVEWKKYFLAAQTASGGCSEAGNKALQRVIRATLSSVQMILMCCMNMPLINGRNSFHPLNVL